MRRQHVGFAIAAVLSLATLAHAYNHLPRDIAANFSPHQVRVQTYDRNGHRPRETGGAAGEMKSVTLTDTRFGFNYTYTSMTWCECEGRCHCGHPRVRITVRTFHVSGDQSTRVIVPSDATKEVKAHEQKHYDLDVWAYNQARIKAEVFARGMLRRTFEGGSIEEATAQVDRASRANSTTRSSAGATTCTRI